jgi:hypothetical protein
LPKLPQFNESPPKLPIEQIIEATNTTNTTKLQQPIENIQDISYLNINICNVITQIINIISETTPIDKMSINVNSLKKQVNISINTSVLNAIGIYNNNVVNKSNLKSSFEQWIKEKTIIYLKDLYVKTDQVQNIIKTLVFYSNFLNDDIITNLMKILNTLYTIIDKFYTFFITENKTELNALIQILIDYETNVVDKLFIDMQENINDITANPAIQNIFFPQQGGSRKYRKNKKQNGGEVPACLPKLPQQPPETKTCITPQQIFIEHLICGYPTPPPKWVFDELDKLDKKNIL